LAKLFYLFNGNLILEGLVLIQSEMHTGQARSCLQAHHSGVVILKWMWNFL